MRGEEEEGNGEKEKRRRFNENCSAEGQEKCADKRRAEIRREGMRQ